MRRFKFEIVVTEEVDSLMNHPDEHEPHEPKLISTVGTAWRYGDKIFSHFATFDKPTLTGEEIAKAGKEVLLAAVETAREKGIEIETQPEWRRVPGTNQFERTE